MSFRGGTIVALPELESVRRLRESVEGGPGSGPHAAISKLRAQGFKPAGSSGKGPGLSLSNLQRNFKHPDGRTATVSHDGKVSVKEGGPGSGPRKGPTTGGTHEKNKTQTQYGGKELGQKITDHIYKKFVHPQTGLTSASNPEIISSVSKKFGISPDKAKGFLRKEGWSIEESQEGGPGSGPRKGSGESAKSMGRRAYKMSLAANKLEAKGDHAGAKKLSKQAYDLQIAANRREKGGISGQITKVPPKSSKDYDRIDRGAKMHGRGVTEGGPGSGPRKGGGMTGTSGGTTGGTHERNRTQTQYSEKPKWGEHKGVGDHVKVRPDPNAGDEGPRQGVITSVRDRGKRVSVFFGHSQGSWIMPASDVRSSGQGKKKIPKGWRN